MRNLVIASILSAGACVPSAEPLDPEAPAVTVPDPEGPGAGPEVPGSGSEIDVGECEGSYRAAASELPAPSAEVDADGRIVVSFDDRPANCCPSPLGTFETEGSTAVLDFVTVSGTSSCDCFCVTDFVVRSEPFPAGTWGLELFFDGEPEGTLEVVVP